ncbi:MAG: MBL fold metallo-hydrolase [Methanomassiliicoccales archaeon]|nr:MBL fold metallo-hydrolase [Methanomassiliicoccales archaeon]
MSSASSLPIVKIVCEGHLLRKGAEILEASSSVSLILAGARKIIVDTAAREDSGRLSDALKSMSVEPQEVDVVVNTHLHIDHCGGNDLFKNAKFYAHRLESPPLGTVQVSKNMTLLPGVELIQTPGHTAGSISVLVRAEKQYVAAGDALPTKANYDQHTPPAINIDRRLALRSMDLLLESADVVIPGHDSPFACVSKKN